MLQELPSQMTELVTLNVSELTLNRNKNYQNCLTCSRKELPGVLGKAVAAVAEEELSKNSARCRRVRWLLKLVVFPPLVGTIFRHSRHTASVFFRGWPFSSAFKPKYIHTADLPFGLQIRSMFLLAELQIGQLQFGSMDVELQRIDRKCNGETVLEDN